MTYPKVDLDSLAKFVKFSGTIQGGLIWDELSRERLKNPLALEPYGYKVYSQNDEDGIIHEIFRRIGTDTKRFVEFGVQDGLESNTHLLLHYGWSGLWIEGSKEYCDAIKVKFRPVISNGRLRVKNAFITKNNINDLINKVNMVGGGGAIDLLSIDIDGNDWYVWDAINCVTPRVVVIEYNAKFPPDLSWKQAYNAEHVWDGSDWHGASLKAMEELGKNKGYLLVGTDLRGCNAFFVRQDLVQDKFLPTHAAEDLYNPLRMDLVFEAKHPARYCLADQTEGLGIFNYRQDYELCSGFHEEEHENGQTHAWTSELISQLRIYMNQGVNTVIIPYTVPAVSDLQVSVCVIKDSHLEKADIKDPCPLP